MSFFYSVIAKRMLIRVDKTIITTIIIVKYGTVNL
jgi:hypothetical protein